jgi:hypothetical protein
MLYPYQWVGFAVILLIPILALFGVFGESFAQVQQSSQDMALDVDYAIRNRYRMGSNLQVAVQNLSDQPIPSLTVSISRDYVDKFAEVTFSPSVARISDSAYEVDLTEIQPGESRVITVELEAEEYGQHQGTITATVQGLVPVEVNVTTFIFP